MDAAVVLTAGWGDGSTEFVYGIADRKELQLLQEELPELIDVMHLGSEHCDLMNHVKWWLCGGDDEFFNKVKDLPVKEFCIEVKKLAPEGY